MACHPLGAVNPASCEVMERVDRKLMVPRPEWNRLGPYIPKRWRDVLARINKRLVLQYFPYGLIPGSSRKGFWSICLKMPRTRLLFKQAVMSLVDGDGRFCPPSWGMLHAIKRGCWRSRHEGLDAELDSLDRVFDAMGQRRLDADNNRLLELIEKSIRKLDPSSGELGFSRISVPDGGGYEHVGHQTILAESN